MKVRQVNIVTVGLAVFMLLALLGLALTVNAQEAKVITMSAEPGLVVFAKNAELDQELYVLWGIEETPKENLVWDEDIAKLVPPEEATTFWFSRPEGWVLETSLEPLGSDWWQIPESEKFMVFLPFVGKEEIPLVVRMSGDQKLVHFQRSAFSPGSGDWDPWYIFWGVPGTPKENIPWGEGNFAEMRPPEGAQTLHFRAPVGWVLKTKFVPLEWDWWNIPPVR